MLAAAAETVPLLVLVDDLQWIDAASAAALLFAARRMHHDRWRSFWPHDRTRYRARSTVST